MKQRYITALVIGLALLAGCKPEEFRLRFSHALHVIENEMECADCHGDITDGRFEHPSHDVCAGCHDEEVESETISRATCGLCHREKDLGQIGAQKPAADESRRRVFFHTEALVAQKLCGECHGNNLEGGKDYVPALSRAALLRTMREACVAGKPCDMCHVGIDRNVAPDDHLQDWTRVHGFRADQEDALCSACHHEETCRECHQATMPASHNNLWRLWTHGVESSWDRARCQLCHEEDFCVACHAETRPRSHNGLWETTHCDYCHASGSAGAGCATCHESVLDSHPDPHGAGWLNQHCDSCHPGSPEADDCRLCHSTTLDNHPDPHGPGWEGEGHCAVCHTGGPGSEDCVLCHPGGDDTPQAHQSEWPDWHNALEPGFDCLLCHPLP